MEVATTTNNHHNHSHHHKHHQSKSNSTATSTSSSHHNNNNNHHRTHQHVGGGLSLATTSSPTTNQNVATSGARSPFQREVREWQRIDPDTGALLSGRLEADRWVAGPQNSYGKISDSQNITQPNGTQHTQRKQLEVLQARTANGAMQVIRAQTVQTTSSRWSSSSSSHTSPPNPALAAPIVLSPSSSTSSLSSLSSSNDARSLTNRTNHKHHHHHHRHGVLNTIHQFKTAPKSPVSTVDICQVSDHDDYGHAHAHVRVANAADDDDDNDIDDGDANDHRSGYLINGVAHRLCSSNNQNGHSQSKSNGTGIASNLPLLDTEPSLKLSNLMKSSSSISSGSNNSITTTTTATPTATMGTHQLAGNKISLQAIVGNQNNEASASTPAEARHQRSSRVAEQPAIYGQNHNHNGWAKSRVGVNESNEATAGGGGGGEASSFTDELHRHRQTTPPTHSNRHHQPRSVFESFRHGIGLSATVDDNNFEGDDEDLRFRLSTRHQRRQQIPPAGLTLPAQLARSISTDDLSTEWSNAQGEAIEEEPGEWKRVSKLRRSFQSSSSSHENSSYTSRRPLDLPPSSVSVARIRAELERGRLMNAAMRTHHVDLAALDKILNAPPEDAKPVAAKRSTFLTAESLKEIRGKLKKLSDESLYKEDFMLNYQQPPTGEEQIEVHHHMRKPQEPSLRQLSPEGHKRSAFEPVAGRRNCGPPAQRSLSIEQQQSAARTTNSLESRMKSRESSSSEWHSRRKSYGFEKMSPPDDKLTLRMDASTDSGLGRSGELGNWSPTEASSAAGARGTVIHFGETAKVVPPNATPAVRRRYRPLQSPSDDTEEDTLKRHSIAVDESQYVRENLRKTSQVHLNGFYESGGGGGGDSSNSNGSNSSASLFQRNQQKRVEFCKTEVHFAAESGRVNIVETDGKPPPTQNFRRRRRTTSGPLQSLVKPITALTTTTTTSGLSVPVTLFGDHDTQRKTITTTQVAYKASLVETAAPDSGGDPINVTVSIPKLAESFEGSRSSYASTSGIDTTDNETDEISSIRGILKNKPIKPKPYHLGENFDTADALWGVQLKPVPGALTKRGNGPLGFQTTGNAGDLVQVVEKRAESLAAANGYSTKINLSLGDSPKDWSETDLPTTNVMNIELHSPMGDTTKPVAKPRLLSAGPATEPTKEPLKIIKEARGARKLKQHELSYFGVQVPKTIAEANEGPKTKLPPSMSTPSRRTLPRAEKPKQLASDGDSKKWPDLLSHSNPGNTTDDDDEHFYENITNELVPTFKVKPPDMSGELHSYNRKTDLKRDAQILSEMTQNADQTMKALNDESAFKDQRRRSLHRRSSKPLETISEKSNTEKITDHCIAVKVSRGTMASEAKRTSRHSTPSPSARARSSSQSSVDSITCPRDRSRSLSSEREYEHGKVRRAGHSSSTNATKTKSLNHRTASTHTAHCSSGDEAAKYTKDRPARPIRSKRSSTSSNGGNALATGRDKYTREHERDRSKYRSSSQRPSSTTHSSQKERVECSTDGRNGSTSRRRKEEHDSLRSTRSSTTSATARTRADKLERSSGSGRLGRSSREEEHHQRSKEHDKEKTARSKGHSSRSIASSKDRPASSQHKSSAAATPTKIRDHRKTTTTGAAHEHHSSCDLMTHSKNPQTFNGHEHQARGHHQPHQPLHHVHTLTTTTIAAKHRERSGKDRK